MSDSQDDKKLKDLLLWKRFTKDIDPVRDPNWDNQEELLKSKGVKRKKPAPKTEEELPKSVPQKRETSQKESIHHQLDRRTADRLKKGKMTIEARLDLHGMRQDEAYKALEVFINNVVQQKKRCVLVITGKGLSGKSAQEWLEPSQGVLKNRVPQWLSSPPLSYSVLKFVQAQPKDGSHGALYVYLRRQK
ncbi:MAG: Smr/MutS family protein [Pseudomonadota bacterium]